MASPVPAEVVRALLPLPAGYYDLFERLVAVCQPDQRTRALWLSGSVGRGVADAGSDLDVVVTVADESYEGFCRGWREWLATVTPTIIALEIPGLPGSFYSVTPGCERFDVVVERVSDVASAPTETRLVVLDRDALAARAAVRPPSNAGSSRQLGDRGPDPERMAGIIEEFFRRLAIFPAAVVARGDWLLGVVGVVGSQELLYDLLVEANQPLPLMGVKQWSSRLTESQRALLESLPVPNPRCDELVAAMLAVREAMLSTGRETAESCGVVWPTAMDAALATYYARELGTSSSATTSSADSASDLSTSRTTRIDSAGE